MKTAKLFAVFLIGLVAATALVQAFSSTGLSTTVGRVLGKLPEGYTSGKPMAYKVYIPTPNLAPRVQGDAYQYMGTRCEKTADGQLRFLAYNRVCWLSETNKGRWVDEKKTYVPSASKTQKTSWSCVKPQVIQCMGSNCPTVVFS